MLTIHSGPLPPLPQGYEILSPALEGSYEIRIEVLPFMKFRESLHEHRECCRHFNPSFIFGVPDCARFSVALLVHSLTEVVECLANITNSICTVRVRKPYFRKRSPCAGSLHGHTPPQHHRAGAQSTATFDSSSFVLD